MWVKCISVVFPPNCFKLLLFPILVLLTSRLVGILVRAYIVRQAAAITYGALGAASTGPVSSDVENSGGSADLFTGWALPRLKDSTFGTEATGLALAGLREFLAVGQFKSACNCYVDVFDNG